MNPSIDPSRPSNSRKHSFPWLLRGAGKRANFIAVIAAIFFLLGLTTPAGPFFLPEPNHGLGQGLLFLPVSLLGYLLGSLWYTAMMIPLIPTVWVVSMFNSHADAVTSGRLLGFDLILVLWLFVALNWLRGIAHFIARLFANGAAALRPRTRFSWARWAVAPALILVLHLLWSTQLPMKVVFAMQKPALEEIADQAIAAPSGEVIFKKNQMAGLAEAFATYRLPLSNDPQAWEESEQAQYEKKAAEKSVTSILIHTGWVQAGYVRDLSRKPGELTETLFRLAPESKFNNNQALYYLGDGWYAYQNAIDW